jgi:hypothetical protein
VGVALDWVCFFLRRRGDHWFAMNDTEAYWFTSTEVVYGVTGTDVTVLPEFGVSP